MSPQILAIMISGIALLVSIGSMLSSRQAAWSIRYYERWFQLARLVLEHPEHLLPLWCSAPQYLQLYAESQPVEREPDAQELVFAEMYIDFIVEVHRRGRLASFLSGNYPGRVPLTNPRTIYLWKAYIRSVYQEEQQRIVDKAIHPAA